MAKMPKPEAALQKLCMDWLASKRIFALRMNSGMAFSEYNGKKRAIRYGVPGVADVLAFRKSVMHMGIVGTITSNHPIWLEFKAGTKQSALQKSFQEQVESEGHSYYIVKSLEDIEAIFG